MSIAAAKAMHFFFLNLHFSQQSALCESQSECRVGREERPADHLGSDNKCGATHLYSSTDWPSELTRRALIGGGKREPHAYFIPRGFINLVTVS